VVRSGVDSGSMVVVVGAGGVGTYAAQTAKAFGAHVAAIDIDANRLEALSAYVDLPLLATELDIKGIRKAVAAYEVEAGLAPHSRIILECSGSAAGQTSAYSLLTHDATLAIVGFTLDKVSVRLSNLMAFDATVFGNWGCLPEHYPAILELIAEERIDVNPFVEQLPMSRLNNLLKDEGHVRRPVLIPDFPE